VLDVKGLCSLESMGALSPSNVQTELVKSAKI
jgi:hypothetical protein